MNSKTRLRLAMQGKTTDRPPLMCQFSLGFLAKNFTQDLIRFWYDPEGLVEAYISAAEYLGFDGILVSISGRNPETIKQIQQVTDGRNGSKLIIWKNSMQTLVPYNDFPQDLGGRSNNRKPSEIEDLDLDDISQISVTDFPDFEFNILEGVLEKAGRKLSVHGEVSTCFEKFLLLFNQIENGLVALLDDPAKAKFAMAGLNHTVVSHAKEQCRRGIDALKLSSPFAGAGFISRNMYDEFILPYEKEVIEAVHREYDIPCYIHTCGAIGDRLDLILKTGTDGIECLDPPPLGTVQLDKAVQELGSKAFIKGNLDSVNELKDTTPEQVLEIAKKRLKIGQTHSGGYILSTACSIAPEVPLQNIKILQKAVSIQGEGGQI